MKKAKILIIDDYRENIEALSALIASDDIEIYSAQNGVDALNLLTDHEFCLALLDVQMPQIDGFQLARLIRGVKRYRHLPIIFVTAHQGGSVVFEGYESGAVDLLFKPLDPKIVRSKVRVFVELAQQKELLQAQVQELDRLRMEADTANLAKSRFLANMSHEIRTPLAAVMGFSELIAKGQCNEKEKEEFVASIKKNGNLLLRLIDDILDLSKIESNHLELESVEFNLRELLDDVSSTLSFRAIEKGVALKFDIPEGDFSRYISDPTRLKQILLNIIGNAIKFTERGTVQVDVNIEEQKSDYDWMKVVVKDEGVGLTEKQAERLFRPFGQADASTARQFGGSGLGLVISKQIAKGLGGDIRLLRSRLGEGSTFEIKALLKRSSDVEQLELLNRSEREQSEVEPQDLAGQLSEKTILAVDDSPENLTLIKMFLKPTGANVVLATGGQEAIDLAKTREFDLILMDVQMPGVDGRAATEAIRKNGFSRPIVALTAHALKSEHDLCRRSGFDDVVVKPINRSKLTNHLINYLNLPKNEISLADSKSLPLG